MAHDPIRASVCVGMSHGDPRPSHRLSGTVIRPRPGSRHTTQALLNIRGEVTEMKSNHVGKSHMNVPCEQSYE